MMLNLSIKPAFYTEKKDQFVTAKNGYLVLDFLPIDSNTYGAEEVSPDGTGRGVSSRVNIENKRTFIFTLKNINELLSLDVHSPFQKGQDEEGTYLQYQSKSEDPVRVLKMTKVPTEGAREYKFTYCEVQNENQVANTVSINLTYGEVIQLQQLAIFSQPYLLGWHVLSSPQLVRDM